MVRISNVFLPNREIDFTKIRSTLPFLAAFNKALSPSLFFKEVPEIPSSEYMPTNSQLGLLVILEVYSLICALKE